MKIDAHQHFWQYNAEEYGWIGPGMARLKKDYLPLHLAPLLAQAGIEGTVSVQARQTLAETEWLLELAGQHPFIKGVLGWVDLRSPMLYEKLERLGEHAKLCGVRHVLQDEPDDDFMLNKDFIRGLGLLAKFDLVYDLLILPRHLPVACKLVQKFPEQRFVLDHIAKPFIADRLLSPWASDMRRLATYPHVFCKVSGMVTEADWQRWQPLDFRPYLDVIFESFGPRRIMFGSDWPVCTLAGTYGEVFELVAAYVGQLSAGEQADVLGNTAISCYGV